MGNTNTPPRADQGRSRSRTARTKATFGIGTVMAIAATLLTSTPVGAAEAPPVDGKSAASAAASCWEIKQKDPQSASGVYWLVTPAMTAPEQFYCDQVTDGGGWVMVGRGRNDWKEYYQGVGTARDVSSTVTGTAAFAPKQLSSETVDDLLNGQRPDSLDDGIRLRRARDAAGTTWQEGRVKISAKPYWNWTFGSGTPVTSFSLSSSTGTASGTSGLIHDFGTDSAYSRVRFQDTTETSWQRGFRYGDAVTGSPSSTSYLWTRTEGGRGAMPFTQMYLRPKVTQNAFAGKAIPETGTAAAAQRALPQNGAEPTQWGAVERADGQQGELNTEVQVFEQIGNTVFAGGNFKAMQRTQAGGSRVGQSYLAAFDVNTGELRTGFRPVFDGQVKALAELPNNRLAVGGRFSTVNGTRSPGFVVLDATTGQIDASWKLEIENRLTSGVLQIRSMDVQGDWLYLGGAFTHLSGGDATSTIYARSGARIKISTRTPDATWNPGFNGTVVSVDASAKGDRSYAAGYFSQSNGSPAFRLAAVQTSAGAALATPAWEWEPSVPPNEFNPDDASADGYQQAVREQGGTVWAGGSQHNMFGFDRATFERTSWGVGSNGGDVQTITSTEDTVFGGCHCYEWFNSGTTHWVRKKYATQPAVVADRLNNIGAWDAKTGKYLPGFNPDIMGFNGLGVWGSMVDSKGVLWVGGDVNRAVSTSGANQWAGGFLRFAPRDAQAPAAPTGLKVAADGTSDALTWTAAPESGVTYQVLRNDRPIGTATGTSLKVPHVDGARYAVRAADGAGNVSASTPVVLAGTAPAPQPDPSGMSALIEAGSSWKYLHQDTAAPEDWAGTGFDDAAWKQGSAVLGWGDASVKTPLVAEGTRPLTTYYRKSVDVADASKAEKLTITTRADDGIVVYVNGEEVVRSNLPEGTVNHGTWATAAPRTSAAVAAPVTVEVPGWALHDGKNVISAEVHSNWRSTTDATFDLSAVVTAGTQPAPPAEDEPPAEEEPADPDALVAEGATWKYHHHDPAPGEDWAGTGFDDAAWKQGSAVLGWGDASVKTPLVAEGTRPLTTYYRKSVDVADASKVEKLTITTRADDAVAVYVNGEEVVRSNLPEGTLGPNTYATAAPRTAAATAEPVVVEVPGWALQDGRNVIAAEVHSNWRSTTDATFDLSAVVTAGVSPEQPVEQPAVLAAGSEWSYRHQDSAPEADWDQPGTVLDWAKGKAPLGWGGDVATELAAGERRPLATQFRKQFTVADPAALGDLRLTTRADDGIVVKVNGQEVVRSNMPDGDLDWTKYALSAPRTSAALAAPVTTVVPSAALKAGVNTVTVSMHVNYRATPDAGFDLELAPRTNEDLR
ncbi:fibrinogen-like YCDxxxxGGGW domain-containing protein [Kocuria sp. CPCC 205258]|uniref:fibrinogen-like YCDxxxxGGGW domain-containing protein n=1 Tax=Kocuria sp. CPCC 205258 TaxID=3073552 RepID=UPI0034D6DB89